MTYALLDKPNPAEVGSIIARAYHASFPLELAEVDALYALICARLCMSICYAAYNARIKSGDAYQQVTAAPAWRLLQDLTGLSAPAAGAAWRRACGMQ
jgi:Ser/Thr protein kinase RdoA (MazF antagonist)